MIKKILRRKKMSVKQVTMISLEGLIPAKHNYRKFKEVFNRLAKISVACGRAG